MKLLKPRTFLLPKFFHYQLKAASLDVLGYARFSKLLKQLTIVHPALHEQQRLVSILDEAIARIATAKVNAAKNRQSSLALFESHLQSVFAGLWRTCELVRLQTPGQASTREGRPCVYLR